MVRVCIFSLTVATLCASCSHPRRIGSADDRVGSTSAKQVAIAYEQNPAEAEHRFNDKRWRLEGVRVDRLDLEFVVMETGDREIRFSFEDDDLLRAMRRGAETSLECEGDGLDEETGSVNFVGCIKR